MTSRPGPTRGRSSGAGRSRSSLNGVGTAAQSLRSFALPQYIGPFQRPCRSALVHDDSRLFCHRRAMKKSDGHVKGRRKQVSRSGAEAAVSSNRASERFRRSLWPNRSERADAALVLQLGCRRRHREGSDRLRAVRRTRRRLPRRGHSQGPDGRSRSYRVRASGGAQEAGPWLGLTAYRSPRAVSHLTVASTHRARRQMTRTLPSFGLAVRRKRRIAQVPRASRQGPPE